MFPAAGGIQHAHPSKQRGEGLTESDGGGGGGGNGRLAHSGGLTEAKPPLLEEETWPLKRPAGPPCSPAPCCTSNPDCDTPPITTSSRGPHTFARPCANMLISVDAAQKCKACLMANYGGAVHCMVQMHRNNWLCIAWQLLASHLH